ncbi:DUF2635 domain-containing protein [Humitalea sp. 24SJ18S-53]|uniref:DUF2635 domain-containing protein n=1 Tax=Humitalea sp. 24SJ18S-53 TaxID=3422307 RepID=UPI003D66F3D5
MTDRVYVFPAPGRRVRDPATGLPIGAEGLDMPRDSFALRRIADGDLVLAAPPAAETPPEPPATEDPRPRRATSR